jgi:hypothetical protein
VHTVKREGPWSRIVGKRLKRSETVRNRKDKIIFERRGNRSNSNEN